jgi:glutamyl-tRNA(Gln) amidotransferase subunit E
MNYKDLDLKVGIEIHQELDTQHKLFCKCPPELVKEESGYQFLRRLRPSQSELGEVDPAALFEFLKGNSIIYQADNESVCLVEMDEEPPGPLNPDAIDLTLIFSLMVESQPVDEIHVMRKMVVDGSNTGGFQRTCVISLEGEVELEGRRYGLEQISLEEDAARKISEDETVVTYRLDRLGIPLMEITTAPDIHTPEEARQVAERIGSLLRATGKVKRGLGTIRQDLNISIKGGNIIEVKGVQDLNIISQVVEYEVQRQRTLLEIRDEIKEREISKNNIQHDYIDVTEIFIDTESRIILNSLKKGNGVWALKIPHFAGLIGTELGPSRRFGTELADHARYRGGVKGIFHTDELPGYNITQEEIEALRREVKAGTDDAVIIITDNEEKSHDALKAIVERIIEAFEGVPEETRSANPDGTTRYTRPRPGAARMYPETDIQLITITDERLERLAQNLPEMPEEKIERFQKNYNLNKKLARQVVDSDYTRLFEEISEKYPDETTLIAVTLTEEFTRIKREGYPVDVLEDEDIKDIFNLLAEGMIVKESIPEILIWMTEHPNARAVDAIEALNLGLLDQEKLEKVVSSKIAENEEIIKSRGLKAFGPLMGMVMSEVRGKAEADLVQSIIRKKLEERLEQSQ